MFIHTFCLYMGGVERVKQGIWNFLFHLFVRISLFILYKVCRQASNILQCEYAQVSLNSLNHCNALHYRQQLNATDYVIIL